MLRRLLLREWILHGRALATIVAIFAAFQVYFVLNADKPRLWLVFTSVYVSFLTVVPFTRDDKFRSVAWSCTLPVSRSDLVRARYAGAWILVAAAFLVAFALAALLPGSKLSGALPADPEALLLSGVVVSLMLALLLPFTIRFGFLGLVIGLAALQILAAALFVASKTTGRQDQVEGGVGAVFRPLIDGIVAARESLGPPGFFLAALLSLVLLNWAGYRFALALFRRREL
jgi:hypothetical protein